MMNYQVVIPARGGSKRFPGKNIAHLGGIPLIAHSIRYAIDNHFADVIWVNTDSEEIAYISQLYGAKVVMRPADLAGDLTPTADVLKFQIDFFEHHHIKCDAIILLQATNPLRPFNLLKEAIICFEDSKRSSLSTFSKLNKKFGFIDDFSFSPDNYEPGQRMQDLKPRFYENGLLYIIKKEAIKAGIIITKDTYPMIVESVFAEIDIDEPKDLLLAEYIINN
jgi:N-acylneuraminate cytidylyltransferase